MILEIVLSSIYISDRHNEKWIWKTGCSTTNWIAQYEKVSPILGSAGLKSFFNFISKTSVSSVHLLSRVWLFATPWTAAHQVFLSITNSRSLLKVMSIKSVIPSNHLILCCPLLLQPSIFPSIRVFSNASVLHIRSPEYWHFSFNISPSSASSRLISFKMDWLDLLQSKALSRVFSNTTDQKHQFFTALSFLYSPTLISIHDYWKNHSFD